MAWISAAAAIGGALLSSDASGDASSQASQSSQAATQAQLQMFNTQNAQQAPYRQAGYNSLAEIMRGFGLPTTGIPYAMAGGGVAADGAGRPTREQFTAPGSYEDVYAGDVQAGRQYTPGAFNQAGFDSAMQTWAQQQAGAQGGAAGAGGGVPGGFFSHQFNAGDLNSHLAPNWRFALDQGIGATKNAGNLQTGLMSGNTMRGIADYTLAKSGDLYQQAYNNYTANQSNIFNRLSNVAGLGSAANQQSAGLAGSLAPGISSSMQNAGAAQAAGTMGQANALAGGINNALGWYQVGNMGGAQSYNGAGAFQPYYSGYDSSGGPSYG